MAVMLIPVDQEFLTICEEILKEGHSLEEWREIESDDMFQYPHYEGGFDATEDAFCFSYHDSSGDVARWAISSIGNLIFLRFALNSEKYGFVGGNYSRVIVTWGWQPDVKALADRENIQLWDFRQIVQAIADACREHKTYFTDDTARTIQLFAMADVSNRERT